MWSLLSPLWLAAAAAVVVPLAIHLLSRGSARTVRVGSVRLLEARPTRRSRRLRFRRPWLFLLRAALLVLLAVALAAPRSPLPLGSAPPEAWLLVQPEIDTERPRLEPGNRELYRELDRLRAGGLDSRWAASGADASPWTALAEADAAAPGGAVVHLFAPLRAQLYRGRRPVVAREIRWWGARDSGRNRWIESATRRGESLTVLVGDSAAAGTGFQRLAGAQEGLEAALAVSAAGLLLEEGGVVGGDDAAPRPDGAPWTVELAHDPERAGDARYVRAAIAAVAATTGLAVEVVPWPLDRSSSAADRAGAAADSGLRFRLSGRPLPAAELERLRAGGILVTDAGERSAAAAADWSASEVGDDPVRFTRLGDGERERAGVALARSATGETLIEGERVGSGLWLRLHSRFDPAWTDWVHRPELAEWVADLIAAAAPPAAVTSARGPRSDRRELAPGEAAPARRPAARGAAPRPWPEALLWLAVAALLPLERVVALRGRRR